MKKEYQHLGTQIQTQIQYNIDKIAYPTECTVIKTYDNQHADINSNTYGTLTHIPLYGNAEKGDKGILIFLENDYNKPVIITGALHTDYTTLLTIIQELTEKINILEEKIK